MSENNKKKIRLAVPENSFVDNIIVTKEEEQSKWGVEIIRTTEDKCQKMLAARQVDAALITTLAYGKLSDNHSLRIIPSHCVAAEDFTAATTIYFKGGANGIESIGSPSPHSCQSILTKIVLGELYGIETNIEKSKNTKEDIFDDHEVAVLHFEEAPNGETLDLSEEWLQLYEEPLPLFFWTCWADNQTTALLEATKIVAPESMPVFKEVTLEEEDEGANRKGRIHFLWHEKIEKAIDHTLEILFYHQYFREIHSGVIFDPNEEVKDAIESAANEQDPIE